MTDEQQDPLFETSERFRQELNETDYEYLLVLSDEQSDNLRFSSEIQGSALYTLITNLFEQSPTLAQAVIVNYLNKNVAEEETT